MFTVFMQLKKRNFISTPATATQSWVIVPKQVPGRNGSPRLTGCVNVFIIPSRQRYVLRSQIVTGWTGCPGWCLGYVQLLRRTWMPCLLSWSLGSHSLFRGIFLPESAAPLSFPMGVCLMPVCLVAGDVALSAKVPCWGRPPAKVPGVFSVVVRPDLVPNWALCFSCLSSACGFGGGAA